MSNAASNESSTSTAPTPGDNVTGSINNPSLNQSSGELHRKFLQQKRKDFRHHILRSLDIITYLYLTYLYFLDCSLLRFSIRGAFQFLFLTPKVIDFPLPANQRTLTSILFGTTLFCIISHLWEDNPSAGELTHGYLHGGLLIDFIGQEGPISKCRLLYVDLVITMLQLLVFTLVVIKQEEQMLLSPLGANDEDRPTDPPQDVESEERGEHRQRAADSDPLLSTTLHDTNAEDGGEDMRNAELERCTFEIAAGEFEAARMDIGNVLRRQWWTVGGVAETVNNVTVAPRTSPNTRPGVSETENRRWTWRLRGLG